MRGENAKIEYKKQEGSKSVRRIAEKTNMWERNE